MNKKILILSLPALLGLASCSKGTEVKTVEEKKAVINQVAENTVKNVAKDDFTFDATLRADGTVRASGAEFALKSFEAKVKGEVNFPEKLEKGSDINDIEAHISIETSGKLTVKQGEQSSEIDCRATLFELYFEEGVVYSDFNSNALNNFIFSMAFPKITLPDHKYLSIAESYDPNEILDLQEDFEAPEIPVEILESLQVYTSDSAFTFDLDTSKVSYQDESGATVTLKDEKGIDLSGELVIDSAFRFKSLNVEGQVDTAKVGEEGSASGTLNVSAHAEVNYKNNPSVKKVADKSIYTEFKLQDLFSK